MAASGVKRQDICLAMIVKNESPVIRRCLDSVKDRISSWAIIDTGSTDNTREIIRETLRDIPGVLEDRKWVDFSTNRNQALDLARKAGCAYALVIDADEVLSVPNEDGWPSELSDDAYAFRFQMIPSEVTWIRRGIVKLAQPWHYRGEIHEYLACGDGDGLKTTTTLIDVARVLSYSDGARGRGGKLEKFRRDAEMLRALAKKRPDDCRVQFYLAQSYTGAEEFEKAIKAHKRRSEMGGWEEERWFSLYQIAALSEMLGHHWLDVARAYQRAWNARPHRVEPAWALAVLHRDRGEYAVAEAYARAAASAPFPEDSLMVVESIYAWRAADEWAGCLAELGKHDRALDLLNRIIKSGNAPAEEVERMKANAAALGAHIAGKQAA